MPPWQRLGFSPSASASVLVLLHDRHLRDVVVSRRPHARSNAGLKLVRRLHRVNRPLLIASARGSGSGARIGGLSGIDCGPARRPAAPLLLLLPKPLLLLLLLQLPLLLLMLQFLPLLLLLLLCAVRLWFLYVFL
jgi:hypothetical protein